MNQKIRSVDEIKHRQTIIIFITLVVAIIFLVVSFLIYDSSKYYHLSDSEEILFEQSYDFLYEQKQFDPFDAEITECKINTIDGSTICVYFKTESREYDYYITYFIQNHDGTIKLIDSNLLSTQDRYTFEDDLENSLYGIFFWYQDEYLDKDNWKKIKILDQ